MASRRVVAVMAVVLCLGWALAQQGASRETVSGKFGGANVSIEYGRPSLNGRSFQELTKKLPGDRMWRAGSEQVTTLTTNTDLLLGTKRVPAGKYSLYVHCGEEGTYSLAVNRDLGQPLGKIWSQAPAQLAKEPWPHFAYQKEIGDTEVARAPMKRVEANEPVDLFTITLNPTSRGAEMKMSWGKQTWLLDIQPAGE
ncbi:MAG: DUF2911 domain-containing protein [Acidobacteriota bacterium]